MQGDPTDHLMDGVGVEEYVRAAPTPTARREAFFVLTAAARSNLRGLAFRSGYAPYPPFTGKLSGPPGAWALRNRERVPVLLQPLGLWSGADESDADGGGGIGRALSTQQHAFVNRSLVAVPDHPLDAGLRMLATPLHWIDDRRAEQGDRGLGAFWRKFLGGDPPSRLYHAQGAQFAVSAAAIRRHPRGLYRAMLDELRRPDPVASYYAELCWWYLFDADVAAAAREW